MNKSTLENIRVIQEKNNALYCQIQDNEDKIKETLTNEADDYKGSFVEYYDAGTELYTYMYVKYQGVSLRDENEGYCLSLHGPKLTTDIDMINEQNEYDAERLFWAEYIEDAGLWINPGTLIDETASVLRKITKEEFSMVFKHYCDSLMNNFPVSE